ncbi:PHP domain-containing protein [Salsipaludibacter albus]|uniref:PHP domain-containing protein n=1 Tax=Salsipaludibacter albus TaxID=2849650 RepID=UPI001EE4577E|nr:PHP domain-containing protein [Salsipaludibacter albus]MBY5163759.1 PHP domain-containing protein [Salsipaludibacter albus]
MTDHDTMAAVDEAVLAAGDDLEVIPGTEFSAELDGVSVHVLGYWPDPRDVALAEEMDRLRNERERRAVAIVDRFHDLDVPVSMARVRELAGAAPIGRPHIATAVVETGAAATTPEVFDRFLADGGPANVPKHAVDPVTAVRLLVGAGGVAVLAHPGLFGSRTGETMDDAVVEEMAAAGMGGIEADHPDHTPEQRTHYRDLARGLGLVVTAGSDYHGDGKEQELGDASCSRETVEDLRARRP